MLGSSTPTPPPGTLDAEVFHAVLADPAAVLPDLGLDVWPEMGDESAGLSINGVMDAVTVPSLSRTIVRMTPNGTHTLVLDIDGVTHLGACALGLLVAVRRRMLRRGDVLELRYAVGGASHRALSLTNLDRVFPPAVAA